MKRITWKHLLIIALILFFLSYLTYYGIYLLSLAFFVAAAVVGIRDAGKKK